MKCLKVLFSLLFVFSISSSTACSMYKITKNGKTFVGCNHDAWLTTPQIWFEIGTENSPYGTVFTGSRFDGENGYAPQSGMNEHGLVFSRLASYHPKIENSIMDSRTKITNPTFYLKDILHNCKTIAEVKAYIENYDQSLFIEDVFIYIDKSGDYIVVEPYKIIEGNNPTYVLSNFCPSITSEDDARRLVRYKKGTDFLKINYEANLDFCRSVSDTMHVCREKIGDGTLITSIFDSTNGTVNIFFYHDYNHTVQYNLKDELAKGNHILKVDDLFPKNEEFEKLIQFKTPKNSNVIRMFLLLIGLFFLANSLYFLINYFRTRKQQKYNWVKLFLILIGPLLFYYIFILNTNTSIFYFPAPYYDSHSVTVTLVSYLPHLLVIAIFPLLMINYRIIKEKSWKTFSLLTFSINNVLYLVLIGFFMYWQMFF